MDRSLLIIPIAALMAVSAPALASEAKAPPPASIPFVSHGGIWTWTSRGLQTVYFQDQFRKWYKAKLMMPAYDLPYTLHIAVDTGPSDLLDSFSTVIIHGQRYPIRSFVAIEGKPPPEHPAKAKTKAEAS